MMKKKNWKGYAKTKARKRIPKKSANVLLYVVLILVIIVVVYLLTSSILPQLASMGQGPGAVQSAANATRTATINFVYLK
jgi:type II secretory pathway component PulF